MDSARQQHLRELARLCGVEFADLHLLNIALTHPTYVFENRHLRLQHNQRLEFLGDAVLGMLLGEYLYRAFPDKPEGELSKMRAAAAREATLARKARELGLGRFLLLGRGEELSGGRDRSSILADAYESLVAAIYLSGGLEAARRFVWNQFAPEFDQMRYSDYKTELQELVQARYPDNVYYQVLEESGPDHEKQFVVGVFFRGRLLGTGQGRSKKEAEQAAAQAALECWQEEFGASASNINNSEIAKKNQRG
jgi:ribonuclease-3